MDSLRLLGAGLVLELRGLVRAHPFVASAVAFVVASGLVAHTALGLTPVRAAYETARLFFDSADTSFDPRPAAAPSWVVVLLWTDRFLTPLIVAGAAFELVRRVTRHGAVPPWWRGHVVVVVELRADNPNLEGLRSLGATVVEGDVRHKGALGRARTDRAALLYAVTDDPVANFAALLQVRHLPKHHRLRAAARVEDPELRRHLGPLVPARQGGAASLFDGMEIAARDLVDTPRIVRAAGPTRLVVAGYGRFGRAVAEAVVERHAGRADLELWLVDPRLDDPGEKVRAWAEKAPGRLVVERTSMLDTALWARLGDCEGRHLELAICTDNDAGNVAFALAMRQHTHRGAARVNVVVRMLEWAETDADLLPGVHLVSIRDLILDGLARPSLDVAERP